MARRARDIINGLPEQVRVQVENYRVAYTRNVGNYDSRVAMRLADETRVCMSGYVLGLMHAGLITEFERRVIFCYMTVADRVEA
jgi:hypothetical protein